MDIKFKYKPGDIVYLVDSHIYNVKKTCKFCNGNYTVTVDSETKVSGQNKNIETITYICPHCVEGKFTQQKTRVTISSHIVEHIDCFISEKLNRARFISYKITGFNGSPREEELFETEEEARKSLKAIISEWSE
jgi:hypothetical protein